MTSNAQPTPPLDRNWIAAHIPHSGTMRLLDTVIAWDDVHIRRNATSHRDTASPLHSHGQLAAVYGIEYATQVMVVHGALHGAAQTRLCAGFLASVRSIKTHVPRLGTIETLPDVEAERIGGDGINVLYRFTVHNGAHILLTGRAAVMSDVSVA